MRSEARLVSLAFVAISAFAGAEPPPPRAKVVPHRFEEHGRVRVDDYYWLRERENPEVVAYLEAENAYTAEVLKPVEGLKRQLFDEIVSRIEPNDDTVPYRLDDYYYYRRFVEGGEYPLFCRKRGSLEGDEQILLDGNALSRGYEFFSVQAQPSPRHGILAYSTDTVGRRFYHLRFKNLTTGETLPDEIPRVTGNVAWANDDKTIFYTRQDPETLRSDRVYRHVLGTDPSTDELVFEESDETFVTYVYRTKSRKYVVILSYSTLSTEQHFLDADAPHGSFQVFLPRRKDHEYTIDHAGNLFYVRTNDAARNFRLMATPSSDTSRESWQEIIPHREDVYFEGVEVFDKHLALAERKDGLLRIRILPTTRDAGGEEHYVEFEDPTYVAYPAENPSSDTSIVRFEYSSLTTPTSVYDYDMVRREKKLLKRDAVLGDFAPENYRSERLWARARDGIRVPVSLVYRKDAKGTEPNPLLLYAYGSYGYSTDPEFDGSLLSLLDRGFVYAIAHVRGGQELGRDWSPELGIHPLETRPGVVMDGDKVEHVREAIPVISSYGDALGIRAFAPKKSLEDDVADKDFDALASLATVPVINMESAIRHPCQSLADWKTMDELSIPRNGGKLVLSWANHPKALPLAVPAATVSMAAMRGMETIVLRPEGFELPEAVMERARRGQRSSCFTEG